MAARARLLPIHRRQPARVSSLRPARYSVMPLSKQDAHATLRGTFPILEPGHVWLAGAGPGDPGLLTLDAVAGLAQADVVVHEALVDKRVLALARSDARLEFAGKRGGKPSPTQADISKRLIAFAREGHRVLRDRK